MKKIFKKLIKNKKKVSKDIKTSPLLQKLQEKNKLYKFLLKEHKKILKEINKYNLNKKEIEEFNRLYKNFIRELDNLKLEIIQDIEKNHSNIINIKDFEV